MRNVDEIAAGVYDISAWTSNRGKRFTLECRTAISKRAELCPERWLGKVTGAYEQAILAFDDECAQVWDRLREPDLEN